MSANLAYVWVAIFEQPLQVAEASDWVAVPACGAVVAFVGTVRDHAEGRPGVTSLDYEAYVEAAVARMREIATAALERWPSLGRVAALHRVGHLEVGDPAVVVAVSAAHRHEAFAAAEWVIDTVKESVPIWKKETWTGGSDWGNRRPIDDGGALMANLLYLIGAVVAIAVICGVLYMRSRQPRSMDSGIDSFRKELRALAPERGPSDRDGGRSG